MSRRNRNQNNVKRLAIGSLLAGIFGYLAGILTAPQSGKETRQDIKETADRSLAEAEKDLKKLHTELGKVIEESKKTSDKLGGKAQKDLGTILEKAKDTKEKVREVLSAIHEGDAEDKELAKAIKDANAAIDHLRDYLKK
ncbi:MAG TPA: YtxH domain-containing protein [Verrucomicrobiae bacterium]|jgi:gas vesicle protein|nr:YtxH domain-containing protein [Verrucomicrobiae bacterium]